MRGGPGSGGRKLDCGQYGLPFKHTVPPVERMHLSILGDVAACQLCWAGPSAGTCASPPAGAVTYAYDANGNTTSAGASTQVYNVFDQFTSNTNGGTTNYTYAGTRNDERTTSGGTAFLNGALGIARQTTGGAATSFIRDPDGNLISMRTSTGASYYYTTDALGSVILLTDSSQTKAAEYAYDS